MSNVREEEIVKRVVAALIDIAKFQQPSGLDLPVKETTEMRGIAQRLVGAFCKTYDSGWVEIAMETPTTYPHNLGYEPLVQVFARNAECTIVNVTSEEVEVSFTADPVQFEKSEFKIIAV